MDCPKCRKPLPEGASYCCWCGRLVGAVPKTGRKRANGAGYAYRHHGSWMLRVTDFIDELDGNRQHYKYKGGFKTKSEALAYAEMLKNGRQDAPDISMARLYREWAEGYSARVSSTTMAGYRAAFAHYEELHHRKLSQIRPADLQLCVTSCSAGKRTKQLMKVIAGLLWKYAMDNGYAEKNAAENLYTGKDPTSTRDAFNDLELQLIRQASGSEEYADYVLALCYTGFRPGELLALPKASCNLDVGYVIGGGKTEAGTDRIVTIPPAVADIFRRRMDEPGDLLFPNLRTGSAMSHEYFRKYCFNPLMEKLGISGKVPYSCRHTYSNLIKDVPGDSGDKARLMGHADYTFTQERYQSSAVADLKRITDALV